MCGESFSINYTAEIPEDMDRNWFMSFVTLLNHFYWFSGAMLGGIFSSMIRFNTERRLWETLLLPTDFIHPESANYFAHDPEHYRNGSSTACNFQGCSGIS